MNVIETIRPQGRVIITLYDENRRIKTRRIVNNLVVDTGLAWMAQRIGAVSPAPADMGYMAIGSGVTAAAAGDVALETPLDARVATAAPETVARQTSWTGTFDQGVATGAITEAGIFTALTGGTMMSRVVFPLVNKGVNDFMTVLWTIQMGA